MEEVIPWLVFGVAIAAAVGFVLWIIAAIFVRVVSFVLVYWALLFVCTAVFGVVVGFILPLRVLAGKGRAEMWQIVPQDLVDGRVAGEKPPGPNREYGWDRAWPNYVPYQASEDAKAVGREVAKHVTWVWGWLVGKGPGGGKAATSGGGLKQVSSGLAGGIPRVLWWIVVGPGAIGYTLGAYASVLTWFIVMGLLGTLLALLQQIGLLLTKLANIVVQRRKRASMKCTHCYGASTLPGYRCSGADCTIIHWTLLPGPLGSMSRRCECGQQLPNTVRGAAELLQPVCPYCREDLVAGSGGRQTIQLAVIGSIGAGKSRLLDAITVELGKVLAETGGAFEPLNDRAKDHQARAEARLLQRAGSPKTQHEKPVGLPFTVSRGSTTIEAQVMDVAGEAFSSWDETAKLRYLDSADGIILALDPLALPEVNEAFRRSSLAHRVLIASGDQEEAYGSAVDRMRADQVRTEKRGLAVVLTKGDVLMQLPVGDSIRTGDSAAVRSWLVENGSDLMVRRFEKDFRDVRYFVADSMEPRELRDRFNPWWIMDWLLSESRASLKLGEALAVPESPPAPEPAKA